MNESIMRAAGFEEEVAAVKAGRCPFCKQQILGIPEEFTDALSFKEFTISGLCQKCQDEMFGGAGDE
jgi:hypothetical protein